MADFYCQIVNGDDSAKNGINCTKFYWFGIFCSAIICIVVSTFLDYRVLFSKGDFYTWIVSFTIFVISVTVSDIIMLQVTALSRFLYLRIRYSIKCPLCIFPFLINSVDGKLEMKIGKNLRLFIVILLMMKSITDFHMKR